MSDDSAGVKPKVQVRPGAWAGRRVRVTVRPGLRLGGAMPLYGGGSTAEYRWRDGGLDVNTFDKISLTELATLMVDLSPEISREANNILRIANSGWELTAVYPDGRRAHRAGQAALNAFLERLNTLYGSADTLFNQLFLSIFIRGAISAELVLSKDGRSPVDLIVIDPILFKFQTADDPDRGEYWQLGQIDASGTFRPMKAPTVLYAAFDPLPGLPEGRSGVQPALFVCLTLMRTLRDLSRVIAQQGYPRLDIEVSLKELADTLPEEAALDAEVLQEWADAIIAQVQKVYSSLEPDDAYVHSNAVKLNRPVGTVDTQSLGAIDSLMRVLERQAIRALRTMPLLMSSNESVTEAHANRQWEVYALLMQAIQHLVENGVSRLLSLMLQAQGIPARALLRFAPVRATEEYRDALTMQVLIDVYSRAYYLGLVTLDEAAQAIFQHNAAREEPIQPAPAAQAAEQPAPGQTVDGEETQALERRRAELMEEVARLHDSMNRLMFLYEDGNDQRLPFAT